MLQKTAAKNTFIEARKGAAAPGNFVSLITVFVCPNVVRPKVQCGLKRMCREDVMAYFAQVKSGNRETPRYIEHARMCRSCERKSRNQLEQEQSDSLVNDVAQLVAGGMA